jgi:hypothetical protein
MGGLNFILYLGCMLVVTDTSYSGPEGIGSAILSMVSLFFSLILTGFGLNQLYAELSRNSLNRRTLIATLCAALPLLTAVFSMALRLKTKI